MLLGVALAFEVPIFVLGLVRLRILSAARLRQDLAHRRLRHGRDRRGRCPGVDPVSTILSVLPLVVLYVLSIGLATILEPRWRGAKTAPTAG